jgi:hypothetical protein
MGNDIDVCSKDDIEGVLTSKYGPSDEGSFQFLRRLLDQFSETIKHPLKRSYTIDEISFDGDKSSLLLRYEISEFNVFSQGNRLAACLWRSKRALTANHSKNVCILYVHTNTRSLVDALEVFPVADALAAHVISFDLPGCGKSEGSLNLNMHKDIECLIDWAQCLVDRNVSIILWGRGLGTFPVIELVSNTHVATGASGLIKCVVLDSPFTGVKRMAFDFLERFQGASGGLALHGIVSAMLAVGGTVNGMDISKVKPIKHAALATVPCFIFSAMEDDYIACHHGQDISVAWPGPVQYHQFHGSHFSARSNDDVLSSVPFLTTYAST